MNDPRSGPAVHVAILAAVLSLVAVAAFAPGLAGPYVLDDHANLVPIWQWLAGERSAASAVLDNGSGPLGRPIAYLTLLLNAALGGQQPLGYKLLNLALHLAGGGLILLLLRQLLERTRTPRAWHVALALTGIWLLHPLQVSAVLYVVQRMTLLSAIAQLAALLVYLHGRTLLAAEPARARALMFIAFPFWVAIGLACKENAVVAPLLVLGLELGLFQRERRPREVALFFAIFLLLPAGAITAWWLVNGGIDALSAGFAGREFTLTERLLTQPRVLGDYLVSLLLPTDAHLALYRDGYPHSTDLLSQPATLLWAVVWAGAVAAALLLRRKMPLLFLGVFLFLGGHALEAGPIALEPYYEHRNYLPSLGIWLALYALMAGTGIRLDRRSAAGVACALVLVLAVLTAHRSWQWGDVDRLNAAEGPPPGEVSRRLQVNRAIRAFELNDYAGERRALAELAQSTPGNHAAALVWTAIFRCDRSWPVPPEVRAGMLQVAPAIVTHSHVSYLEVLARRVAAGKCEGLSPGDLEAVVTYWIEEAGQPVTPVLQGRLLGLARGSAGSAM